MWLNSKPSLIIIILTSAAAIVQHGNCVVAASAGANNNIFKPTVVDAEIISDYLEVTSHYSFMDDVVNDVDHAIVRVRDHHAIVTTDVGEGIANNDYDDREDDHRLPHDDDGDNLFDASLVEPEVVVRPSTAAADSNNMLTNQVICGYQGWFGTPGDGSPLNRWKHWFHAGSSATYQNLTVDMYPTTDEYNSTDLVESNIKMPDGTYAKFFSSARPNVVLKHFQWMQTYGITGVFHHRFVKDIENIHVNTTRTMVLKNVRYAVKATGRKFAVSYDLAGSVP